MSAEPAPQVSSAFPPPPPFYKHFTSANLAALRLHEKAGTAPENLPEELQYLKPPPLPLGSYRCFGDTWQIPDVLHSLADMGITQLYPDTPAPSTPNASSTRASHLLRLSKSILMSYLELISLLAVNPQHAGEKFQDLRNMFINMHHLINEYRPHQARETLILMMEEQIEQSRLEAQQNRKAAEDIRHVVRTLQNTFEDGLGVKPVVDGDSAQAKDDDAKQLEATQLEEELEMWKILDQLD